MKNLISNNPNPDILFWVGCAGAFDERAKKVTKTFAKILDIANINYSILGNEEKCTGDPARRSGNEFVFQMLALQNIETLNQYNIKKIVTTCPHCFNTLKNEYPELGGNYEVIHHTQLLQNLLDEGKIKVKESADSITYHDSCYLGRANNIYEVPRNVLENLKVELKEMKRCKAKGLCCGAGGAQMFKEDEPGNKRINQERIEEVLETNSKFVAANCPFCITMLEDGLKSKGKENEVMVYDLSELIFKNIQN